MVCQSTHVSLKCIAQIELVRLPSGLNRRNMKKASCCTLQELMHHAEKDDSVQATCNGPFHAVIIVGPAAKALQT